MTVLRISAALLAMVTLAGCSGVDTDGSQPASTIQAASSRPPLPAGDDGGELDDRPVVLFFGTSLTAGLGVEPEEAYPALIQHKLDSAGLAFRAENAGVSGETSAAGLRRIDWILREPIDVLVLELGANDALRGLDLSAARENLQEIIDRVRDKYPDVSVVLAGMQAPPNLGTHYTEEFRNMFTEIARENEAALIPFLLEGVGGVPGLNQGDGIHPTARGQEVLADNVWAVLEPVLRQRLEANGEEGRGKKEE